MKSEEIAVNIPTGSQILKILKISAVFLRQKAKVQRNPLKKKRSVALFCITQHRVAQLRLQKTCKIVRHPQAMYLNTAITSVKNDWDITIIKLIESGKARTAKTAPELKQMILENLYPERFGSRKGEFLKRYIQFAESRNAAGTVSRMRAYDPLISKRKFRDIDRKWLSALTSSSPGQPDPPILALSISEISGRYSTTR